MASSDERPQATRQLMEQSSRVGEGSPDQRPQESKQPMEQRGRVGEASSDERLQAARQLMEQSSRVGEGSPDQRRQESKQSMEQRGRVGVGEASSDERLQAARQPMEQRGRVGEASSDELDERPQESKQPMEQRGRVGEASSDEHPQATKQFMEQSSRVREGSPDQRQQANKQPMEQSRQASKQLMEQRVWVGESSSDQRAQVSKQPMEQRSRIGDGRRGSPRMERDLEMGMKEEISINEEDNEIFFDCEEYETSELQNDEHRRLPQETNVAQDSRRPAVDGEAHAHLIGHDLKTISKIFNAIAGTVGFGLLLSFVRLTFGSTSSILYRPSQTSCSATADYVTRLYEVVSIGLCFSVVQFFTSLLAVGKKEIEAAPGEPCPPVPVMRRVCILVAAVSHIGLTACMLWSLQTALSLRIGKMSCWKQAFSAALFTGYSIISIVSLYLVYIASACVFGTK